MISESELEILQKRLEPELKENEKIIWADRPKPTVRLDVKGTNLGFAGAGGLIAFIGWTFYKHSYYDGTWESFMKERIFAVALMTVGLVGIVLPFLLTYLKEQNTKYVLTNQRFFFLEKRKIKSFGLSQLSGFKVEKHSDGYATIRMNPYDYYTEPFETGET